MVARGRLRDGRRHRRGRGGHRVHGARGSRVPGAGGRGAGGGRAHTAHTARDRRDCGRLVVLRGECALVQHMLTVVGLGRRLDVHEGDGGARARRDRRARARAFGATQQFNVLNSAIAETHALLAHLFWTSNNNTKCGCGR